MRTQPRHPAERARGGRRKRSSASARSSRSGRSTPRRGGCWRWRTARSASVDKAVEICEEWLAEEPDDPIARHMLAACSGRDVPARASDGYVETIVRQLRRAASRRSWRSCRTARRRWWRRCSTDAGVAAGEEPRRARRRLRHRAVRAAARAVCAAAGRASICRRGCWRRPRRAKRLRRAGQGRADGLPARHAPARSM